MSEIARKKQKIFGKNAISTDLGVVGSKSNGTQQFSTDVETLQSLSQFETGLRSMVTATDAPYLQDQNSLFYIITSQLAYLFQAGVAEWNSETEYFSGKSFVVRNGTVYKAIQNSTNKDPLTEPSYWIEYLKTINYLLNTYDSNVSTAIGGYPQGAVLDYVGGDGYIYKIKSLIANNTNVPTNLNIKLENSGTGTYYWEAIKNRASNIVVIVDSYDDNNGNGYCILSDNTIIQWGSSISGNSTSGRPNNLNIPFTNNSYRIICLSTDTQALQWNCNVRCIAKTTSTFTTIGYGNAVRWSGTYVEQADANFLSLNFDWIAIGK